MNKEEIIDFLDALRCWDLKGILKYSDLQVTNEDLTCIETTKMEQIFRNIMSKIENGDYEFFSSRKFNKKYRNVYLELMTYSDRTDEIKKCIEEYQKLNISSSKLKRLIIATHDPAYIKSIIEDDKKRNEMKFWTGDIIDLISATEDLDYIKLFIEDKDRIERFGFGMSELIWLIKNTKDEEYIRSFINFSNLREMYCSIENLESRYTSEYFTEFASETIGELVAGFIADLIAVLDPKYIKEVLNNQEKVNEYGFNISNIFDLVKATKDFEFIKSIIEDDEKSENLCLSSEQIIELIIATGNQKYILDILEGRNKVLSQILDKKCLANILFLTQGKDYIKANVKKYLPRWGNVPYSENKKINLPEQMTVGIEIETEGWQSDAIKRLTNIIGDDWTCKDDASLDNGVEVTSPILTGDFDKATRDVMQVFNRLDSLRTKIDRKLWRSYTHRS